MSSRIEIKLPSRMEYLGIPDAILMEIGSERDCCRRSLEELGTSLIEACTNAMEHGNKLAPDEFIEVIFELDESVIVVTVLDNGNGFDYRNWQPSQELMRERGRGILIMREFCDELVFDRHTDGRFLVRLTKHLRAADEEDATDGTSDGTSDGTADGATDSAG